MLKATLKAKIQSNRLVKASRKRVLSHIKKKKPLILGRVRRVLKEYLEGTEAIRSLKGETESDSLKAHLGLIATKPVNDVVEQWISNVQLLNLHVDSDLGGGFDIVAVQADYLDVLALPLSQYETNGNTIPWLRWLLLEADTVRIAAWRFRAERTTRSRSGLGSMTRDATTHWEMPGPFNVPEARNFINVLSHNSDFQFDMTRAIVSSFK